MRYLIKHDVHHNKGRLAVIPSNSESKDFKLVRFVYPEECSASSIEKAIRETFHLEPVAEVVMDFVGDWDSTVSSSDNTFEHPFLSGVRVKREESR